MNGARRLTIIDPSGAFSLIAIADPGDRKSVAISGMYFGTVGRRSSLGGQDRTLAAKRDRTLTLRGRQC
jgi:hypothetical protein